MSSHYFALKYQWKSIKKDRNSTLSLNLYFLFSRHFQINQKISPKDETSRITKWWCVGVAQEKEGGRGDVSTAEWFGRSHQNGLGRQGGSTALSTPCGKPSWKDTKTTPVAFLVSDLNLMMNTNFLIETSMSLTVMIYIFYLKTAMNLYFIVSS